LELSTFGYQRASYGKNCNGENKVNGLAYRVLALRCLVLSGDTSFRNTQRFSTKKLTPERSEFPILFFKKFCSAQKIKKKFASRIKFCFQPRIQKKTKRSEFGKPGFSIFFMQSFKTFFESCACFSFSDQAEAMSANGLAVGEAVIFWN